MHRLARAVSAALTSVPARVALAGTAAAAGAIASSRDDLHAARAPPAGPERAYSYVAAAPPKPLPELSVPPPEVRVPLPQPKVLFVLGGPGAGKGTQCTRLVREFGYVHLSAGDLLRDERDSGSPDGAMITQYINEGKIVPVEVTVNLIKKAMAKSGASKFLVDGFPRNFNNLEGWQSVMGDAADVQGVLFYECPESVMEARLLERGKTSGRSDDNADVIRKRFKTYLESTLPVIKYYENLGRTYRVEANASVDTVYAATKAVLAPLLEAELKEVTQTLLDAVHAADWETYAALTSPALTAIEPESNYQTVVGTDFHKYYFTLSAARKAEPGYVPSQSTMADVRVQLLGAKAAVVTYTRIVQKGAETHSFGETRVWNLTPKGWVHVHFHRSPAVMAS